MRASTALGLVLIGAVAWIGFRALAPGTSSVAKIDPSARVSPPASEPTSPSIFPSRAEDLPNFKVQLIEYPETRHAKIDNLIDNEESAARGYAVARPTYEGEEVIPGHQEVQITFMDAQPTDVQHIVFNGRVGKKGCDLTRGKPKRFEMGDTQSFPWNGDCGESFVRIDIYTDRGMVTYEMKDLK
jgi:hypothetical protein